VPHQGKPGPLAACLSSLFGKKIISHESILVLNDIFSLKSLASYYFSHLWFYFSTLLINLR
jgi:hypothetical protein